MRMVKIDHKRPAHFFVPAGPAHDERDHSTGGQRHSSGLHARAYRTRRRRLLPRFLRSPPYPHPRTPPEKHKPPSFAV